MRVEEILTENLNLEGRFTYGGISYNSMTGIGSVPNNTNVNYMGFAAGMRVDTLLALAAPANRMSAATKIADMIIDEGVELGPPFPNLDTDHENGWHVRGHEGRARATAIKMLSDGYRQSEQQGRVTGDVIVHFFLGGEYRSRHINQEFLTDLASRGIEPEKGGSRISTRRMNLIGV